MVVTPMKRHEARVVDEIARLAGIDLDAGEALSKPWARVWVARTSARAAPVGFVLAWFVADEVHVIDVATHPGRRRMGVARSLIERLLREAALEHARLLVLEVRRSNRAAIRLYRSLGFSAIGIRRGYYADESEDAVEMVLALDPETGHIQPGRDEIRLAEAPTRA